MLVIRWLPLLFLASAAQAQVAAPNPNSYLVLPTLAQAQARSAAQCAILKCQPGTTYWWAVIPLTDGTAAIEIQPSGDFAMSATKTVCPTALPCTSGKVPTTGTLTPAEQAALKPAATIAPLMPAKP